MKIRVESKIDIPRALAKIDNDAFWTEAATEWWRLISPYTPMRTGALWESVSIRPKEIEYEQPYAARMYNNKFNFRRDKHPRATNKWDAAARPAQEAKLISALQRYIDSGRIKLND